MLASIVREYNNELSCLSNLKLVEGSPLVRLELNVSWLYIIIWDSGVDSAKEGRGC